MNGNHIPSHAVGFQVWIWLDLFAHLWAALTVSCFKQPLQLSAKCKVTHYSIVRIFFLHSLLFIAALGCCWIVYVHAQIEHYVRCPSQGSAHRHTLVSQWKCNCTNKLFWPRCNFLKWGQSMPRNKEKLLHFFLEVYLKCSLSSTPRQYWWQSTNCTWLVSREKKQKRVQLPLKNRGWFIVDNKRNV